MAPSLQIKKVNFNHFEGDTGSAQQLSSIHHEEDSETDVEEEELMRVDVKT